MSKYLIVVFLCATLAVAQDQDSAKEIVYKVGGSVKAPVPIYQPDPELPERMGRAGCGGRVTVQAVLDTQGVPRDIVAIKSTTPELEPAAISAISNSRFKPAMKDGKPVAVHIMIDVEFRTAGSSGSCNLPTPWESQICSRHTRSKQPPSESENAFMDACMLWKDDKSTKKIAEKFLQAAELGETDAQLVLGGLYLEGRGVKKSKGEALKWFRIAQTNGNLYAPTEVERLIKKMKPKETAEAEEGAQQWLAAHPQPQKGS
jgi:TonB family protein